MLLTQTSQTDFEVIPVELHVFGGRVNLRRRRSGSLSREQRRWNHSNRGFGKSNISEENTNRAKLGIGERPHGN